jgi:hypothetical protein
MIGYLRILGFLNKIKSCKDKLSGAADLFWNVHIKLWKGIEKYEEPR